MARVLVLASVGLGALATVASAAPKGPAPARPAGDRLVVVYRDGATAARRASARDAVDATLAHRLPALGADVLTVPAGDGEAALEELRARPGVASVERDVLDHVAALPDDPLLGSLWNLASIGASRAWDQITDSSPVVVGVVDSGVSLTHRDLAGQLWRNPGESGGGREANGVDDDHNGYVDDVDGWDFAYGTNDPSPNHPHGTHVAGTIGAAGDNGLDVTGVAWRSTIMPVAAIGPDGSGYRSDIADAFAYAADNGARIVNASLAGAGRSDLYRDVMVNHPNTLFVVAAGNDADDDDAVAVTPCDEDAPNVICVAASDASDRLAGFSNHGATSVDVAAPGVDVLSLMPGDATGVMSGTSMAAPLVSGVAALTLAARPWLSTAQLRAAVLGGATRVPALAGLVATGARVDAPGALAVSEDDLAPTARDAVSHATPSAPPAVGRDATAPAFPAPRAPAPGATVRRATLAFAFGPATDAGSGLRDSGVLIDGRRTALDAFGRPSLASSLADGPHRWSTVATDNAGNVAASPPLLFTLDDRAPTVATLGAGRLGVGAGGVAVRLRTGEPARATVTLEAGGAAARALGLRTRRGVARLGSASGPLGPEARTLEVDVRPATLARLRHRRPLTLRLTVAATDGAGNRRTVVRSGRT